jgi:hypothetical protein
VGFMSASRVLFNGCGSETLGGLFDPSAFEAPLLSRRFRSRVSMREAEQL